jgi:hypothetical protein
MESTSCNSQLTSGAFIDPYQSPDLRWHLFGKYANPRQCRQQIWFSNTEWYMITTSIAMPSIPDSQFYYTSSMSPRYGAYLGFQLQLMNDQTLRTFFVASRNGYDDWTAVDSSNSIIPMGVRASNDFDWGELFVSWGTPVVINNGDYDYIYYSGWDADHTGSPAGFKGRIGLARFRKDGLTALKATSDSDAWARTTTIPSQFRYNFTVNGNFTSTAKLNISVINANTSTVYPGFDFSDFTTITTNSTSITPRWGGNSLDDIPDGNFKLNFSWDGLGSGELYSYGLGTTYYPQDEEIEFIDINGGINGTIIYNATPTFNWTIVNDASQYWLQIDNNVDFSSPEINITNINQYTYPSNCDINSTRVSFTLSVGLTNYDKYYCRVKALVKS